MAIVVGLDSFGPCSVLSDCVLSDVVLLPAHVAVEGTMAVSSKLVPLTQCMPVGF
jgi:hypothetical protein